MLRFLLKAGAIAAGVGLALGGLKKLSEMNAEKEKEEAVHNDPAHEAKPANMPETPEKVEPLNMNLVDKEMAVIDQEGKDGAEVYDGEAALEEKLETSELPAKTGETVPEVLAHSEPEEESK